MRSSAETNSNISSLEGTTESLRILNERNINRMKPIFEVSIVELNADINNILSVAKFDGISDSLNRLKDILDSTNDDFNTKFIRFGESIGSFLLRYGKILSSDPELKERVKILLIDYVDTVNKTNNQDVIDSAVNNVNKFFNT